MESRYRERDYASTNGRPNGHSSSRDRMVPERERDHGKLFVSGLSADSDEKTLEHAFAKFGPITEVIVIRDKTTDRSRGYGFVTYENDQDCEDALKSMDGKEFNGSDLHVEAAVKNNRGGRSFGRGGSRGGFRGRGGYDRGGFSGSRGGRGSSRGYSSRGRSSFSSRGSDRYSGGVSSSYRDSYSSRDTMGDSSREYRSSRDYGRPPPSRDYGSSSRERSSVFSPQRESRDYPSSRAFDTERSYGQRSEYSSSRDYGSSSREYPGSSSRDYPVSSRDYPPTSSRDYARPDDDYFDSPRDYPTSSSRYDTPSRREYEAPSSRYESSRTYDSYPSGTSFSRDYDGASRGPPTSRGPPASRPVALDGPSRDYRDDWDSRGKRSFQSRSSGPPPKRPRGPPTGPPSPRGPPLRRGLR